MGAVAGGTFPELDRSVMPGFFRQQLTHERQFILPHLDGLIVASEADFHILSEQQPIIFGHVGIVAIEAGGFFFDRRMGYGCLFQLFEGVFMASRTDIGNGLPELVAKFRHVRVVAIGATAGCSLVPKSRIHKARFHVLMTFQADTGNGLLELIALFRRVRRVTSGAARGCGPVPKPCIREARFHIFVAGQAQLPAGYPDHGGIILPMGGMAGKAGSGGERSVDKIALERLFRMALEADRRRGLHQA